MSTSTPGPIPLGLPVEGPHLGELHHLDAQGRRPGVAPFPGHKLANGHWCFRVTQTFANPDWYWTQHGRPDAIHAALDLGNFSCGDKILAAADGTATRYTDYAGALAVIISHGGGWVTRYWHLAGWLIPSGSSPVRRGQAIGVVGGTGLANGVCHLHFEVAKDGKKVDPWPLLEQNQPKGEEDVTIAGRWIGHITNRRAETRVNSRFREGPDLASRTLAIFPARTGLFPIVKVGGQAVGEAPDKEEWYGAWNYVSAPAESGGPIGWCFGYYHSSTLERTSDGKGAALEEVETSGVPESRYAEDVKQARIAGADGATKAARRYTNGLEGK